MTCTEACEGRRKFGGAAIPLYPMHLLNGNKEFIPPCVSDEETVGLPGIDLHFLNPFKLTNSVINMDDIVLRSEG